MVRDAHAGAQVVVCSTCAPAAGSHGLCGGAALARALRQARAADPALADIAIDDMACLFACARHCAVHIRAPGKIGYVLGGFAPDAAAAEAILDYAAAYRHTGDGVVPYAQWPDGVKGHFIARVPPAGPVPASSTG
jgi:predicted metal-binding protein